MKRTKKTAIFLTILFLAIAIGLVLYLAISIENFKANQSFILFVFVATLMGVVIFLTMLSLINKAVSRARMLEKEIAQLEALKKHEQQAPEEQEAQKKEAERLSRENSDLELVEKWLAELEQKENIVLLSEKCMSIISETFNLVQGICFARKPDSTLFSVVSTYAFYNNEAKRTFEIGDGISGQVAKNQKSIEIANIPDGYITVLSGLGQSNPKYMLIVPLVWETETIGLYELAFFEALSAQKRLTIERLMERCTELFAKHITTLE